jgi:hypothetical protein
MLTEIKEEVKSKVLPFAQKRTSLSGKYTSSSTMINQNAAIITQRKQRQRYTETNQIKRGGHFFINTTAEASLTLRQS